MLEALAYKRGFEPDEEEGDFAAARAWPRVLDLFAGSGGLGIEALSRGAQSADFVEQDRDAARSIESNLRATGLADRAHVHHSPVLLALPRVRGPVDLVFADPPYADTSVLDATVSALERPGLLSPTSAVVIEQPWSSEPPSRVGALPVSSTRRHGRTRITLYTGNPR